MRSAHVDRYGGGFTLTEAVLAIAIVGIVLAAMLPAFLTYSDTNTLSEERSGAVAAAQQTMESWRQLDPTTLVTTGAAPVGIVEVGNREYEVISRFCTEPTYCDSDTRHILVEVRYGGRVVYTVESVFTRLR